MKRPWMPLYVADYLADTTHLRALESGAYLHLIMHYWQHSALPNDDRKLAAIAKMTTAEWRRSVSTLGEFFTAQWKHKRIDIELAKAADISSKRSASAKLKHNNSHASAPANAEQLDTHARATSPSLSQPQKDSDPNGSARDIRGDLFGRGLKTLAEITGKTPDSCRSLVGRWLKVVNDEAIHVLGAIENAERNRVADPVAWITRALHPHRSDHGKRNVHDAARDQLDRLRALDEPEPTGLRDDAGQNPVRLLSAR